MTSAPSPAGDSPAGTARTVAVTGAGGKTGRSVLRALVDAGHRTRALVRPGSDAAARVADTRAATIVGDMTLVEDLLRLLDGCDAVYHIPPNMTDAEQRMAAALIEACVRAGVPRIVYHSVLHPQIQAMPHHWHKLRVEELLLASDLEIVVMQPAPYMQNLLPYLAAARHGRVTPFPYGPHVALSMVDLRDVGAAATVVVDGDEHLGGTYQLCAGERLTQGQAWAQACAALDLTAPYRHVDASQWQRTAGRQAPEPAAGWLVSMFEYYDRHGLVGSSLPLARLLGRPPRSLAAFLADLPVGR